MKRLIGRLLLLGIILAPGCALAQPNGAVPYSTIPDCRDTLGNHLNYNNSTFAISCGSSAPTAAGNVDGFMPYSQFLTGRFYPPPTLGSSYGAVGSTANTMYACPFVAPNAATVTSESYDVTTLGSGTGARMGIYTDNGGTPNALVSGSDSGATTPAGGFNTVSSLTISLAAHAIYWSVILTSGTGMNIEGISAAVVGNTAIFGVATVSSAYTTGVTTGCVTGSQTYGAMPGTFPSVASRSNAAPTVVLGF